MNGDALHKIGKRIREIRKVRGFTQESLGEKCGFTFSYIGGIERGENNVSIRNLEKIAVALDVELHEFFIDNTHLKAQAKKNAEIEEMLSILLTLNEKDLKKAKLILNELFKNN